MPTLKLSKGAATAATTLTRVCQCSISGLWFLYVPCHFLRRSFIAFSWTPDTCRLSRAKCLSGTPQSCDSTLQLASLQKPSNTWSHKQPQRQISFSTNQQWLTATRSRKKHQSRADDSVLSECSRKFCRRASCIPLGLCILPAALD